MTYTVLFDVTGVPAQQGSKSIFHGRIVEQNSHAVKKWRKAVEANAQEGMDRIGEQPFTGAVSVTTIFRLPRGKTVKRDYPSVRPDADKLARNVGDALTGIAYVDDAQIVEWNIVKRYVMAGEEPGCAIKVTELP